ncbi:MAG TPA: cyclase family protein [Saprospiraceae bacterium]|nr:cyclase family protein [Saprospiraceae bacterium]
MSLPQFHHDRFYDLSISYHREWDQVNCFFAPLFSFEPVRMGAFVGSVKEGGPVNFMNVKLNVHGNGTHTECVGHLSKELISVQTVLTSYFFVTEVLSVYPTKKENGDLAITKHTLEAMLQFSSATALVLRTLPNDADKRHRKYSGTNPCYIEEDAMQYIVDLGIQHLLVDIPSVDREEDGGALLSHRCFWKDSRAKDCTITELIFVSDAIKDGQYLLYLQLAPLHLDAVPSRPILYELNKSRD